MIVPGDLVSNCVNDVWGMGIVVGISCESLFAHDRLQWYVTVLWLTEHGTQLVFTHHPEQLVLINSRTAVDDRPDVAGRTRGVGAPVC